jgi:phosphatidylglycerol:prolipoprotein diacylglycerol transferase
MHPVLFNIGPLPVRAYGAAILVGYLLGLRYTVAAARRRMAARGAADAHPITPDAVLDMALVGLVCGVVGARLVFVALYPQLFRSDWTDVFRLWTGGLSFIGAPVFGFGYAWWYCRRRKLPFLAAADMAAPAFALGYVFGRIGCLLNGCCYGRACDVPWAMQFPLEGAPGVFTAPSHPTQIYSALASLAIFGILDRRLRGPHAEGEVFITYGLLYALYRFINEWFRRGATANVVFAGLTEGQIAAALAVPVLAVWLYRRRSARN